MENVDLSVVIGTYNRHEILIKCLDALIDRIKASHEIIVVDAGSTDGTLEYLEKLSGIRLIKDEKRIGQAQSLNRVFKTLKNKYVCWLSDDNIIQGGMLDVAVNILERNPDIGLVGLKVRDITGPYSSSPYLGGIWPSGVLNCNQGMLPTKLMQQLGGFDEHFRDYGIDADLTTRVLLMGYKVVFTKSVAIHHYRDHEGPGWIDSLERKQRLEKMLKLYERKFAGLLQTRTEEGSEVRPLSFTNKLIGKVFKAAIRCWAKHPKLPLRYQINSLLRDWHNISQSRFMSRWDILTNLFQPYYLVQYIPEDICQQFMSDANKLRKGAANGQSLDN